MLSGSAEITFRSSRRPCCLHTNTAHDRASHQFPFYRSVADREIFIDPPQSDDLGRASPSPRQDRRLK